MGHRPGEREYRQNSRAIRQDTRYSRSELPLWWKRIVKCTNKYRDASTVAEPSFDEPLIFTQRAVLASETPAQIEKLLLTHQLFKTEEARANELLSLWNSVSQDNDHAKAVKRSYVRALFSENLKKATQLSRMFPCDLNQTPASQDLLERFHEEHGLPNEEEKHLLAMLGGSNVENVDQWCK
ncbi:hypothetical protein MMC20_001346 [Loxospora ochrophaea]|nr:hypothetical protein [Loxospora ochrophaea]